MFNRHTSAVSHLQHSYTCVVQTLVQRTPSTFVRKCQKAAGRGRVDVWDWICFVSSGNSFHVAFQNKYNHHPQRLQCLLEIDSCHSRSFNAFKQNWSSSLIMLQINALTVRSYVQVFRNHTSQLLINSSWVL